MSTENYDPLYPDQPVVDQYLPVWASQHAFGSKPAFIWADDGSKRTELTYSQLNAAVQRIAQGLLGTVRRGDAVLLLASPGLRLVTLIFACQRAGLVAVSVVPPKLGTSAAEGGEAHRHLLRAVSQTRPSAAVADAGYIDTVMKTPAASVSALKSLRWVSVCQLETSHQVTAVDDEDCAGYRGCGPNEVYLIQYTSGATGAPKPVVVTAGAAAHNARAARTAYGLHPGSVVASWLPQYHDCGLMFLLLTVVSGATCALASPAAFLRRPRLWLELVAEFRATCTPVPSFSLPLVLRRGGRGSSEERHGTTTRPPLDLSSLRNLILVNEPIYESSVEEFVREYASAGLDASSVSPSYGLAENCTFVSTAWRSGHLSLPSYKKLLPVARLPLAAQDDTEIEIVVVNEETGEPVADGVEGDIWISSPSNASGYLGHPSSASHEAFRARLPGRPDASFVRTGDRGVVHGTERYLYVLGRSADAIAVGVGWDRERRRRVHAHYIETAAFDSSPGSLRGGCIAAFATSSSSVAVVAELRKGRGGVVDKDLKSDICDGIRRTVWKEEGVRIRAVVLVESGVLPKTTSGKLCRGAARAKLLAGELPTVFVKHYVDASDSTWLRDGSRRRTSWVELQAGAEHGDMVVMASGGASQRRRLQSSL